MASSTVQDHRRPHNGDGFGFGYYTPPSLGPDPCIFTSTTPAWNCINLSRLASKTTSSLIFAHVRATTEGSIADFNCHPFSHGSLMFMHNGNIACWRHIKREIALSVGQKWFTGVQGNSDSEWAFALFLDCLDKAGFDPDGEECALHGFGHTVLRKAMLQTIKRINGFVDATPSELRDETVDKRSLLNFAVSDGHSVVCTRYVSSTTDEAASLYFSSGTSWKQGEGPGQYKMERRDKGADIVLVASEPLTFERGKSPMPNIGPLYWGAFLVLEITDKDRGRQLGHSAYEQHHYDTQTNGHDPSHHRRVLQSQSLTYEIERLCGEQRPSE